MKNILSILFLSLSLFSCGPVLSTFYGLNKNRRFDSKVALADYYVKKNKLDRERIYFFTTNEERESFMMNEIISKGKNEYYGIQLTDSTMVDDTNVERQWCMGVVGNIISSDVSYQKVKTSNIKSYKLVDIEGNSYDFNAGKPTVVFLIDSNAGRLINKNIGYVVNHIHETNTPVNYIYVAVDYLPEYKIAAN